MGGEIILPTYSAFFSPVLLAEQLTDSRSLYQLLKCLLYVMVVPLKLWVRGEGEGGRQTDKERERGKYSYYTVLYYCIKTSP